MMKENMSQNVQTGVVGQHYQPYGNQSAQSAQTIVIQMPPQRRNYDKFAHNIALIMGSIQLWIGILCIVVNLVSILAEDARGVVTFVGHGIWCGVFFIVTGGLGLGAGRAKNMCLIISFMVMSIISASLFVPAIIICASFNLVFVMLDNYLRSNVGGVIAVNSILLVLAVAELIVAVISSVVCCRGVCCCKTGSTTWPNEGIAGQAAHVVYIPQASGSNHGNVPPMYTQQGNMHLPQAMASYGQPMVYSEPQHHHQQPPQHPQQQHNIGDGDKKELL